MNQHFSERPRQTRKIIVTGLVQGVGFRPFVYRLAHCLNLSGNVQNTSSGVTINVEGEPNQLDEFAKDLVDQAPPVANVVIERVTQLAYQGYSGFTINVSSENSKQRMVIPPDLALCRNCLLELSDSSNRRFGYPLINCTDCGPRFSIIYKVPYDRPHTSMAAFPMCFSCQNEYQDPMNRRFHAEPISCPDCGPQLKLFDREQQEVAQGSSAIKLAAAKLIDGDVIAIKGVGGFHLIGNAALDRVVKKIRQIKCRDKKPLAVMFDSAASIHKLCVMSAEEEKILTSSAAPIVLLKKRMKPSIILSENLAAKNPYLGVILAYSPLHVLLLDLLPFPIVATSANISSEPICYLDHQIYALDAKIPCLTHNRPILNPLDDSLVQVIQGRPMILRRARGYCPLPSNVTMKHSGIRMIAAGVPLKNSVAFYDGKQMIGGQYLGDIDSRKAIEHRTKAVENLRHLLNFSPDYIIKDAHPDADMPMVTAPQEVRIQHHYAHVLAGMMEHQLTGPVLGIAWDGAGYGLDHTIWGGEFFLIQSLLDGGQEFSDTRFCHLEPFPLLGGDKAAAEPKRVALALLFEVFGPEAFNMTHLSIFRSLSTSQQKLFQQMLIGGRSIKTSSMGRLFDGVSALLGLVTKNSFEGEAATALEFCLEDTKTSAYYEISLEKREQSDVKMTVNWKPMVERIVEDLLQSTPVPLIAAKFHNALIELTVAIAKLCAPQEVVLAGGCFQNRYLLVGCINRLTELGKSVYWGCDYPVNDGGIAIGQLGGAIRQIGSNVKLTY